MEFSGPPFLSAQTATSPAISTRPDENDDGDFLTNQDEADAATNPTNTDSDSDSALDGRDSVPKNATMKLPAAPEVRYALIDLGAEYLPSGVNDRGDVLLVKLSATEGQQIGAVWSSGNVTVLGEGVNDSFRGPLLSGVVYFGAPLQTTGNATDGRTFSINKKWSGVANSTPVDDGLYSERIVSSTALGVPLPATLPNSAVLNSAIVGRLASTWTSLRAGLAPHLIPYSLSPDGGHSQTIGATLGWSNDNGHQTLEASSTFVQMIRYSVDGQYAPPFELPINMTAVGNQVVPVGISSSNLVMSWGQPDGSPPPLPFGQRANINGSSIATLEGQPIYHTSVGGSFTSLYIPEASAVEDLTTSYLIYGTHFVGVNAEGKTALWHYDAGVFTQQPIEGHIASHPYSSRITSRRISKNVVVPIGDGIWRNGRVRTIKQLLGSEPANYTNVRVFQVSPTSHMLLASASKVSDQQNHAMLMIPADIAVDANRDGIISYGGSSADIGGTTRDNTSKDRPFRFWCNDDDDGLPNSEGEVVVSASKDYEDGAIQTARDLEDFSRLQLFIGSYHSEIAAGTMKVGLKWSDTNGTSPKIKVYKSTDTTGTDSYLKGETAAFAQVSGPDAETLGEVAGENALILDREGLWSSYSASNPKACLLFEGSGEGKGQLVVTIHDQNGDEIGEGPGVWLDLKDVRKMYSRMYGKPRAGSVPWKKPDEYSPYQEPVVTNAALDAVPFDKPFDETSDTIVLVHGIHGATIFTEQQAIDSNTQMASTTFKRLWWQGFKGRFGFYKWEAHNLLLFNESEYRAWKSGRGLAAFLSDLPGDSKNVICFSQGGVVGSSAIRDYGATPDAMIFMQAAIPAVCYDDDPGLNIHANDLPDTVADLGYRGYHGATVSSLINFADPSDVATGLGWRTAQNIKPEPSYVYDVSKPSGDPQRHRIGGYYRDVNGDPPQIWVPFDRGVTDLHESVAMIAEAKSNTIAHEPDAGSRITFSVNLKNAFGFDNEHGAAFDRPIQQNLNDFYDEALTQFGIPFNP